MFKIIRSKRLRRLEARLEEQRDEISRLRKSVDEYGKLRNEVHYFCRDNGYTLVHHVWPIERQGPWSGARPTQMFWEIVKG